MFRVVAQRYTCCTFAYNVIVTTCHVAMRIFLYILALALRPSVDPRSSKHPSRQLFTPGAIGGLSAARLFMLMVIISLAFPGPGLS